MDTRNINHLTVIDLTNSRINDNVVEGLAVLSKFAVDIDGNIFREFTDKALNDSVDVLNGAIAYVDHVYDPCVDRGIEGGFGVYQNIQRKGDKIFGDLHLWNCDKSSKVKSIVAGIPKNIGNSVHVGSITHYDNERGIEVVDEILPRTGYGFLPSIDLVRDPSTTVNIWQSKPIINDKENLDMDFKGITKDLLASNRPDLVKEITSDAVAKVETELKDLQLSKTTVDGELKTAKETIEKQNKEIMASKLIRESGMESELITDVFQKQLYSAEDEAGMKEIIADRIAATKMVATNSERNLGNDGGNTTKVEDAEFVNVVKSN